MKKIIGILGGMGPLATCDLFCKIVKIEEAANDQDHVRVLIDSNTSISDRTAAVLCSGADPLPELSKSAALLQKMGADVLIMPCNTAHYYYEALVSQTDVSFLHMPKETAKVLQEAGIGTVGLLATDGTIRSGVYEKELSPCGIRLLVPSPEKQAQVMSLIYDGVKVGKAELPAEGILSAVEELRAAGAETMILGCTELPLAYARCGLRFPHIDPTMVLACRAVEAAGGRVKPEVWKALREALREKPAEK